MDDVSIFGAHGDVGPNLPGHGVSVVHYDQPVPALKGGPHTTLIIIVSSTQFIWVKNIP